MCTRKKSNCPKTQISNTYFSWQMIIATSLFSPQNSKILNHACISAADSALKIEPCAYPAIYSNTPALKPAATFNDTILFLPFSLASARPARHEQLNWLTPRVFCLYGGFRINWKSIKIMFSAGHWRSNPCPNVLPIEPCRCSSTSIMAAKLLSLHIYLGAVAQTHTHTGLYLYIRIHATHQCLSHAFACNTASHAFQLYYCTQNHRQSIGCRYIAEQAPLSSQYVCMHVTYEYGLRMCSL